jgi:hypothetical protein
MQVDNEIEAIESIIADIESAISELKHCSYFEEKAACWEDDLRDLNARLKELEEIQAAENAQEMEWQKQEYYRSVI